MHCSHSNARLRRDVLTTQKSLHRSARIRLSSFMSQLVVHSVDSCIAEGVLVQLGHQTQRHEDQHLPDRSFTLQHPRCHSLLGTSSYWLHSCTLSVTFLKTSSFAFVASLSGLVLGVQIFGALRVLLLIDFSSITSFLCASSSVLSVVSCNVTSFTASCVRIFLRSPGLSSPLKGTTPEIVHSGSVRLMSRRPWPA